MKSAIWYCKYIHSQDVQPSPLPHSVTFPWSQKETPYRLVITPRSFSPSSCLATNLLSVSKDLPILNISHQWKCTACGLLCLCSFTQHNVTKVHPYCRKLSVLYCLWSNNILSCGYATFCLSPHQLIGIWVISTFWLSSSLNPFATLRSMCCPLLIDWMNYIFIEHWKRLIFPGNPWLDLKSQTPVKHWFYYQEN